MKKHIAIILIIVATLLLATILLSSCGKPELKELESITVSHNNERIELPLFDYPDSWMPNSSSVEFPDGLKIIVDYSNTERYKNQTTEWVQIQWVDITENTTNISSIITD